MHYGNNDLWLIRKCHTMREMVINQYKKHDYRSENTMGHDTVNVMDKLFYIIIWHESSS